MRNPSEEGHLETTTTTAFVHPEWSPNDLANDMAILKVDKITFNGKSKSFGSMMLKTIVT